MSADLIMIISFILMVAASTAAMYLWLGIIAGLFTLSAWCYLIGWATYMASKGD